MPDRRRPPARSGPASALPSRLSRTLAFLAVLIGGLCGGLIGYAFTDLQCDGDCTVQAGLGGLAGAVVGAVGVAIVAVLTLRAMDEWETIRRRDAVDDIADENIADENIADENSADEKIATENSAVDRSSGPAGDPPTGGNSVEEP